MNEAEERAEVKSHSAVLHQDLGLSNLVLTQILFVMGLSWVGVAAKLGPSHVVYWLLAVVLFYAPSAVVVIHLVGKMPLEGGLYQWAKIGFSDRMGFLVAWNLWIYAMVLMSEAGLQAATNIAYAWGPQAQWLVDSKWFVMGASLVIIAGIALLSSVGLGAGRWVHGAGGVTTVVLLTTLVVLPLWNKASGGQAVTQPFGWEFPALTLLNLNLLGKLGFGALGGFEYVAIFAGETREPGRLIGRSVMIAAPIIAALFILGTGSVLWFIPMEKIDLISPISQVLSVATGPFGVAASMASAAIMLILGIRIAQVSVNFAATSRLPMVAGWDRLLPAWFTQLHERYKTPTNSILFVGILTVVFSFMGIAGVGSQEAMQLFTSAAGIFYALTYLVLFALPLMGTARREAPWWVRAAAVSGFLMTLLYTVLSIFPIIRVGSVWGFAGKVGGLVVACNVVALVVFAMAERRRGVDTAEMPVFAGK